MLNNSPGQNVWNTLFLKTRHWEQKAADRLSNYQHPVAGEVNLDWFYWQLLSRHLLNWKCRNKAAPWESAGSQWFSIFFMASVALPFALGIKSPYEIGSMQACWVWLHDQNYTYFRQDLRLLYSDLQPRWGPLWQGSRERSFSYVLRLYKILLCLLFLNFKNFQQR